MKCADMEAGVGIGFDLGSPRAAQLPEAFTCHNMQAVAWRQFRHSAPLIGCPPFWLAGPVS